MATTSTVPFDIGRPSDVDITSIRSLSEDLRKAYRKNLFERSACTVPNGPYPCEWRGTGWCQLTFPRETVDLKYTVFGMHLGLDVVVTSLKGNGKVDVIGKSEYFDVTDGKMKIQENGWKTQISGKGPS